MTKIYFINLYSSFGLEIYLAIILQHMINSTKISTVFLAIVLLAGTVVLSSPSFITGVNAQSEPYLRDNVYEPQPEYPPQYADSNSYNSYEPEYEIDSYKKSYINDYYEQPEYQSYKLDYKSQYPSNGQDSDNNYYKSKKDSISSVSINKLDCINNNVNINGNNTGDVNVGNSGRLATGSGTDEGYLDVGSLYGNGEEGYDNNGYNKQKGESFTCIINNNNINNNFGTGNATDGGGNVPDTCEECFRAFLNANQISAYLAIFSPTTPITLDQFCNNVESGFAIVEAQFRLNLGNPSVGLSEEDINALIACLENVGIEFS